MNFAGIFLIAVMWNLLGVCAALGVVLEAKVARPVDLRHAFLILVTTMVGTAFRGQPFQWVAWAPILVSSWLTVRFVVQSSERARAMRLLGRAARPT